MSAGGTLKAIHKLRGHKKRHKPVFRYVGWVAPSDIVTFLSIEHLSDDDEQWLNLCVDAANRALAYWRPDLPVPTIHGSRGEFSTQFSVEFRGGASRATRDDDMIVLGVTMLASRWFQRRGVDVAAFAEFGGPVPSVDRDIEQLLRVNRAHAPVVA